MRERYLFRGCGGDFQGSIDEEGRLYDEMHRLVGRIEGNAIYDTCNLKQGTIDENGKLWDSIHVFVGEERGKNFIGQTGHGAGLVRGDYPDEGRGVEYGALMLLKKKSQQNCDTPMDFRYEFGDEEDYGGNQDRYDEYDDDEYESDTDDSYGGGRDDYFTPGPTPHRRSRHTNQEYDDDPPVSYLAYLIMGGSNRRHDPVHCHLRIHRAEVTGATREN